MLNKTFLGYFFVGGTAACVDSSLFYVSVHIFKAHYLLGLILGFIPGVFTNLILCHFLLFKRPLTGLKAVWLPHFSASVFSLLVNATALVIFVQYLELRPYVLARILAIGVGFIVSYVLICHAVFAKRP